MSVLFQPLRVGPCELRNRFVRSATGEGRADREGVLKESIFPIYEQLSAGGVGLIVSGHMYVTREAKCSPGQTGVWDERHLPGLTRLAAACKSGGAAAVAQLNHAHRPPHELKKDELENVREAFAAAARRALAAGFDGVQVHAAHGYFLSGFLTPAENRRDDEYGRDAEGRRRLLLEVVREVRAVLGPGKLLLCKLGVVDGRDNSLELEESVETARCLEREGMDALEISTTFGGEHADPVRKHVSRPEEEAWFEPQARAIKAACNLPLILVGGLRSLPVMERLVEQRACELVSMCRPFIREPDLVQRFAQGRERAECISCNQCYSPRGFRCVFTAKDASPPRS